MGMSRGAGAGLEPALGDVDGEDEAVDKDSDDISFGREFGLGDGARGGPDARGPFRPEYLRVSSADEVLLGKRALGSDGEVAPDPPDIVSRGDPSVSSPTTSYDPSAAPSLSLSLLPFLDFLDGCCPIDSAWFVAGGEPR